jgi:uncharacterized protein
VDQVKAVHWLHKAAENGSLHAIYELGVCAEKGLGVERDVLTSLEWYKLASAGGMDKAMDKLGKGLLSLNDGDKNRKMEGFYWIHKAATVYRYLPSMVHLGLCYQYGEGVEKVCFFCYFLL